MDFWKAINFAVEDHIVSPEVKRACTSSAKSQALSLRFHGCGSLRTTEHIDASGRRHVVVNWCSG
jgi:hypothetical protein